MPFPLRGWAGFERHSSVTSGSRGVEDADYSRRSLHGRDIYLRLVILSRLPARRTCPNLLMLFMRPLRDTHARSTTRVRFLGVEGGVLPVLAAAGGSLVLLLLANLLKSLVVYVLAPFPFVLTYGYLLLFVTGRRPHFARDLARALVLGRAVSPLTPKLQPRHPRLEHASDVPTED